MSGSLALAVCTRYRRATTKADGRQIKMAVTAPRTAKIPSHAASKGCMKPAFPAFYNETR
ncbi:MAG: hypothetical protein CSB33_05320 [Desulfobacterales bacterium]|nr:MAG: hypothetical protein CSB33_05320 [Desulfobacterales bacterium]